MSGDSIKKKREEYLIHLWKVNRPFMSGAQCLEIVSNRMKMMKTTAREILERHEVFY